MANFVTKKDDTRAAFDSGKIKASIMAAASDAGLSDEEAGNIASDVLSLVLTTFEEKEEVSTTEIRERVLSELDVLAPSVSEAWRKYDETKG